MKFKVSCSAFYSRLTTASKVLASKNSMPILDCFLFDVKDGIITITASDSEKYLITSLPLVECDGESRFCVAAKTIMDPMKELAEQPLELQFNPQTMELKGVHNNGQFSIIAQDAQPYPAPREVSDQATELKISSEVLLNGINRTLFATANDEVRMVMNGILFDIKPDTLIFAATDGRKLVRNTVKNIESGIDTSFILPKKVASIVRSVMDKSDEEVVIRFDVDKASITTADLTMYFRLIEGRYPNYNAVIPQNNPYVATVDRAALLSALKRVLVFCNQSSGLVKMELKPGTMHLAGQDLDYSTSAEENIFCEYSDSPISIGFSCQYLLEIVSALESDSVAVSLADPSRPGILLPVNTEENADEVLMLLMPMRVEE